MGLRTLPADRIPEMMEFARIAGLSNDVGSLRSDTLHLIRRIFRSDSTIFWLTDQQTNRAVKPLEVNVQQRFFPMYRDYYYRKNPFDPVNLGSFSGTSLSMEQVVPYSDFQKTEYYNDFIRPQKIRRQMVIYIRVDNKLISLICTHRSRNQRFDEEDLAAGDMVSAHLSAAFQRIHLLEQAEKKGSFFQMIFDTADVGIAVLDLGGKPLFTNRKAAEVCSQIKGEAIPKNEHLPMDFVVPPPLLKDCEAVKKRFKSSLEGNPDPLLVRERILWISSFKMCLFRVRIVDRALTDFNHPLLMITMEILPVHPKINDHTVGTFCNLTKRETEIVSYIFKGYRNAEIADRLFISEGTVKNHLRNIFEKVQVKNRTGLIHKVLSL